MGSLFIYYHRAKTIGWIHDSHEKREFMGMGWNRWVVHLFWRLDIIGMVSLAAVLGLILTPMTIAKDKGWLDKGILLPLLAGTLLFPVLIYWEIVTKHPLMPWRVSCISQSPHMC